MSAIISALPKSSQRCFLKSGEDDIDLLFTLLSHSEITNFTLPIPAHYFVNILIVYYLSKSYYQIEKYSIWHVY